MSTRKLTTVSAAIVLLAACGQAGTDSSANAAQSELSPEGNAAEDVAFEAPSGEYKTDYKHRYITFSYVHKGLSSPWLRWRSWEGVLDWNADDPSQSTISVTIDANSIDSGVDEFDGHLKGDNFFDTANHPEITFVSTDVTRTGDAEGTIVGDLTIKGVTKPVTLDVTYNTSAYDERGQKYVIGFSGTTTVKRSDFGVDLLAPLVSDEVDIIIETEFEMPSGGE